MKSFSLFILIISTLLIPSCSNSESSNSQKRLKAESVQTISNPGGNPDGVTVANSGNIYMTDISSGEVKQISDSGEITVVTDLGNGSHPDGITSVQNTTSEILYVADTGTLDSSAETPANDGVIKKIEITNEGNVTVTDFVDSKVLESPAGIAADQNGNLYVADQSSGDVYKIPVTDGVAGTPVSIIENISSDVSLEKPHGLTLMANNDGSISIFVTDQGKNNNNIVSINIPSSGDTTKVAISNVTEKTSASDSKDNEKDFNKPHGIAADKNGAIFVCDENNNRIQVITPSGNIITYAGNGNEGDKDGEADTAQFNAPRGLALDNDNNLLVCDYGNGKIKKIKK